MTFLRLSLPSPKVNQQVGGACAGGEPGSDFRPQDTPSGLSAILKCSVYQENPASIKPRRKKLYVQMCSLQSHL